MPTSSPIPTPGRQPDPAPLSAVTACHNAALYAGNPTEAHLLDDDTAFFALAARCVLPEATS